MQKLMCAFKSGKKISPLPLSRIPGDNGGKIIKRGRENVGNEKGTEEIKRQF